MKRVAVVLAAVAIALLTGAPAAWGHGNGCGSNGCEPTPSPSVTVSETPELTPSPSESLTLVTPGAPTMDTTCKGSTIYLPELPGVEYSGPNPDWDTDLDPGDVQVIVATPSPEYVFPPDVVTSWTFTAPSAPKSCTKPSPTASQSAPGPGAGGDESSPTLPRTGGLNVWLLLTGLYLLLAGVIAAMTARALGRRS